MKKNRLKFAAIIPAFAIMLTGCGMEMQADVKSNQVTMNMNAYMTEDEYEQIQRLGTLYGNSTSEDLDFDLDELDAEKVELDGKTYYKISDSESIEKDDFEASLIELDQNKFIQYASGNTDTLSDLDSAEVAAAVKSLGFDPEPEFASVTYTFENDVIATNGTIDKDNPKVVDFTNALGNKMYAIFTKNAAESQKLTINLARYTNKNRLLFTTDGVINSMTVNGSAYQPEYTNDYDSNLDITAHRDEYTFPKEGTYKVGAKLTSGYEKTFTVTYDKTAPKIKRSGKKLKITEKNGIKKVTVNGKKVNYKTYKFKKSGTYKVKATDKAGNTASKKIKYKKK